MENTKESRYRFMRLYNIYYVCKTCLPSLKKARTSQIKSGSTVTGMQIEEWKDCKMALNELHKISCLQEYVDHTFGILNDIERDQEMPSVSPDRGRAFMNELRNLYHSTETIIRLYESMELGKLHYGVDVKIPKCDSMEEYMGYLKDINFIFTQCPYLLSKDEELKFNNVDVGSQWLEFILVASGSFYILNNLAKLVEKVIAIKSHLLTLKQQEEQLKTMEIKNDAQREAVGIIKGMNQAAMSTYVKELEDELGELHDGEERGKVQKTLELMATLLDKGVEIYSSIETPNEIKALFPTNENNPILPDNIVKLLESKGNTEK